MIIINNPNNPMGVPIPRPVLEAIVEFARARDLVILSDEVYLPLFHGGPTPAKSNLVDDDTSDSDGPLPPPSILTLGYDKAIATGSMSKAFALAGLRIGWVASRDSAIIRSILAARDYTTISVSQLDDSIARYALSDSVRQSLLRRNIALAKVNVQTMARFVDRWTSRGRVRCSWTRPTAGTTAFVRFATVEDEGSTAAGTPVDDEQFCRDVLASIVVMMVPGSRCFGHGEDFKGCVRIGYVCESVVLLEALGRLNRYLDEHLA